MATIEELKKRMEGKTKYIGCMCCPGAEDILPMDTVVRSDEDPYFYTITKDGQDYYHSILRAKKGNKGFVITLQDIEDIAKKNPGVWRAQIVLALRDATYERSDCGTWVLVETGRGYA